MNSRRSRSSSGRPANGVKRTKQGQPGNGQKKAKQEKETNNDLLTTVRDLIQQKDRGMGITTLIIEIRGRSMKIS